MKIYQGCPIKFLENPESGIRINSLTRARRSKVWIRRTRVEHDQPISGVQNIIKEVGIGPKGVFIAANLRLVGRILDREWGYFQKFVSPEVVPYTDGIALSCALQLAQDIPQKYFTIISYEGKGRFLGKSDRVKS